MSCCSAINATTSTHAVGACPARTLQCRECPGSGPTSRGQAEVWKDWRKIAHVACILLSTEAIRQRVGTAVAGTEPCGESWRPREQRAPTRPLLAGGTSRRIAPGSTGAVRADSGGPPGCGRAGSRQATSKCEQHRRGWQSTARTPYVRHPPPRSTLGPHHDALFGTHGHQSYTWWIELEIGRYGQLAMFAVFAVFA